jgi:hypothetical protein
MEKYQAEEWVVVDETYGPGPAEIIRGFLLSCGIEARISQEGAWEAFPLSIGELGKANILVRQKDEQQALESLKDYYEREIPPDTEDQDEDESSNPDDNLLLAEDEEE